MEHDFDPYEHLMQLHQRQQVIEQSMQQIARAFNDMSDRINQLHNRLQILEMVRQHENNSPLSKLPRAER